MRPTLRHLNCFCSLLLGTGLSAQTLTDANSILSIGTVENRIRYNDPSASGWATSGSGNTWDAMGVTTTGAYDMVTYLAPGASPYASTYPTATLCAQVDGNSTPTEWRHWNVIPALAELLGANTDEFIGGRTACEFPLDIGGSFTDSYTIAGTSYTDVSAYVASGSIQAPWGTIPNVVMFQVNSGPYILYNANNLLNSIGYYFPGFGMDLWEVTISNSVEETAARSIGIWPVPSSDVVNVALPFSGASAITIRDSAGRTVREVRSADPLLTLDVNELVPGVYTLTSLDRTGRFATGRLVVR